MENKLNIWGLKNAPLAIGICRLDGSIEYINDAFISMFGYSLKDFKTIIEWGEKVFLEKDREEYFAMWQKDIESLQNRDQAFLPKIITVLTRDKAEINIEVSISQEGSRVFVYFSDVTHRKSAEKKAREAEAMYSDIVETAQDLIWKCDNEGRFVYLNKACEHIYGYSITEMLGRPFTDFLPAEEVDMDKKLFNSLLSTKGSISGYETMHTRKDGNPVYLSFNAKYYKDADGKKLGIQGTAHDITSRKLAEKALEEARLFNDNLIDTANVIIVALDINGKIQIFNPYAEIITGYNKEDLLGKSWFEVLVPRSKYPYVWDEFNRLTNRGLPVKFENPILTKNGKELYISWSNCELTSGKEIVGTISFGIDITDQKRTEKALKESEERYKRLAEATFEGIALTYKGKVIDVNKRLLEIFGYSLEEFRQLKFEDLIYSHDLEIVQQNRRKNYTKPYEHRGVKKDGSIIYLEVRGDDIMFGKQKIRLTVIRDITQRKIAEERIIKSEEKFRNIFNSSKDGILVSDFNNYILSANSEILTRLNTKEEVIIGKRIYDFIPPAYKPGIVSRLLLLKEGKSLPPFELELIVENSKTLPVEINSLLIEFEGKKAILTLIRDLTERKSIQQKVMQAIIRTEERERSRFAKDLHDGLGPLLSAMGIYLNSLTEETSDERREFALTNMERTIDEAIRSIKEISNSISPHILQNFGLDEAIRAFLDKFMHLNTIKIKLNNNIKERIDPTLEITIYRIIVELVNNSMKHSKAKKITIHISLNKDIIEIKYRDDGIGFNIEKINRNSKGMGLFSIRNRVASLNGNIAITSKIGEGMRVNIEMSSKIHKNVKVNKLK
ncbi:MAG: PAS domain S-box protein [Bacteroidales bacterium]|nr:PAS domain S-box protein [Bacteroidales bacterium]